MALINCPECGKEISDRATACPHCGCPVETRSETSPITIPDPPVIPLEPPVTTENTPITPRCTKKVGPVQIDEVNHLFRINGSVPVNGKKDGIGKSFFKGMMAFSTLGMSVAAEKLIGGGNKQKVGDKTWLNFSDLLNYDLLEDDSIVTSGGVGQALVGGALFGGAGAIAGGITGKRVQKKKVESLIIKVTLNNFSCPCLMIPLITKSTKTNSKEYMTAFNLAHQILSALDVITHNQ